MTLTALVCRCCCCSPVHTVRNFTLFVPSDEAIQNAFRSGALNYPYLYAKNATLLEGIVAYHAVPQFQFAGPSKQTLSMKTLLTEVSASSQPTAAAAASQQRRRQQQLMGCCVWDCMATCNNVFACSTNGLCCRSKHACSALVTPHGLHLIIM